MFHKRLRLKHLTLYLCKLFRVTYGLLFALALLEQLHFKLYLRYNTSEGYWQLLLQAVLLNTIQAFSKVVSTELKAVCLIVQSYITFIPSSSLAVTHSSTSSITGHDCEGFIVYSIETTGLLSGTTSRFNRNYHRPKQCLRLSSIASSQRESQLRSPLMAAAFLYSK